MNFTLSTASLVSFGIRPKEGVELKSWNILSEIPHANTFNEKKSYLVMITQGLESEPMNITLVFKVCKNIIVLFYLFIMFFKFSVKFS